MDTNASLLVLLGTLGGALIGSLSILTVTWLTKRSEERKHYRELIINTAVENYKEAGVLARTVLEKRPQLSQRHYPLDMFIIHMTHLADLVVDKKIQSSDVKELLSKVNQFAEELYASYDAIDEAKKQKALNKPQ